MEALYIHIPFCDHICTYCDFYKMVAKTKVKTKYIEYLLKELEMKKEHLKNIKTIYIGGGTPTALPIHLLDYFLYHFSKYINFETLDEFTIEANPIDITKEVAILLKKYHINRVSIGVQSFNKEKLNLLGRNHNKFQAIKAIKNLKKVGINNINIDLIYGTSESFKTLKEDLRLAINLGTKHISAYSLILEKKTILYHLYKQNKFEPIDEDKEFIIYKKLVRFLKSYKYYHYEISNYAIKGYESKHNLVYWHNQKYLGIGAGASYYIDNVRYTNVMNLNEYFEGIDKGKLNYQEETQLTNLDQMQEEMILGLRLINGININKFKYKYKTNIEDAFPNIKKLIINNLLKIKNDHIFIPKDKLYLSNIILSEFV